MKKEEIKACVMRIEGTNNEDATQRAFSEYLGLDSEIIHFKQLIDHADISEERRRNLMDYHIVMFPGGFSSGDYVRSGAIWAARLKAKLGEQLDEYIKEGRVLAGICNGFQVLTNLGYLPGTVDAALISNKSSKFECRFVQLKTFRKCSFSQNMSEDKLIELPVAHGEGRLIFSPGEDEKGVQTLEDNDQIVFKYAKPNGELAKGEYPWNPNGSTADIAGICNSEGNVFGMMPHPERCLDRFEHGQWSRDKSRVNEKGDGYYLFESALDYVKKNL